MKKPYVFALVLLVLHFATANAQSVTHLSDSDIENEISLFRNQTFFKSKNVNILSKIIHLKINEYRMTKGLKALRWNEELRNPARYHNQWMLINNTFSHIQEQGTDANFSYPNQPLDRVFQFTRCKFMMDAENLARTVTRNYSENDPKNETYEGYATFIVNGWINSQGHRKNLENINAEYNGVHVLIKQESSTITVYTTQIAATLATPDFKKSLTYRTYIRESELRIGRFLNK